MVMKCHSIACIWPCAVFISVLSVVSLSRDIVKDRYLSQVPRMALFLEKLSRKEEIITILSSTTYESKADL